MAENSKIEWTAHTFNPWVGCQHISAGCDHCYAEMMMDTRWGKVQWGPHGGRKRTTAANWSKPLKWAAGARMTGERPRVFCASLADIFDNKAPAEWRADLWRLIRKTPEMDWLILTKRPENIAKMLPLDWPFGNVWLGTTCEDQQNFDHRWPILRSIPARVHFVSYEPAIGPLVLPAEDNPDWIICGGESGPGARYMQPEWADALKRQCEARGVAFFMKQMTKKAPIPKTLMLRQFPG